MNVPSTEGPGAGAAAATSAAGLAVQKTGDHTCMPSEHPAGVQLAWEAGCGQGGEGFEQPGGMLGKGRGLLLAMAPPMPYVLHLAFLCPLGSTWTCTNQGAISDPSRPIGNHDMALGIIEE